MPSTLLSSQLHAARLPISRRFAPTLCHYAAMHYAANGAFFKPAVTGSQILNIWVTRFQQRNAAILKQTMINLV